MPVFDENMTSPYVSIDGVRGIWQRYNNVTNASLATNAQLKAECIARLQTLEQTLLAQEQAFYRLFHVSDAASIKDFKRLSDDWAATGMNILFNDNFIQDIYTQIAGEINLQSVLDAMTEIVNKELPNNPEILMPKLNEVNLAGLLNKFFGLQKGEGAFTTDSRGLNAQYIIREEQGRVEVIPAEGGTITQGLQEKLAKYVSKSDELTTQIQITSLRHNIEEIKRLIYKSVAQYVSDGRALAAFNYELHNRKKDAYNYCYNPFVLKGWLGELYWNAGLSYILNLNGASTPVGNLKNTSGKSLSVDIILNEVGFQVKSWNTNEMRNQMTHTTFATRQFGNFVSSAADIPLSSDLGTALLQMFGAWSFNKPTSTVQFQNEDFPSYEQEYLDTYSFIANGDFSTLNTIFLGYLDKILRIDNGGELAEGTVLDNNNQRTFFNTFWLVNDNVYPSSAIIHNMIEQLQGMPVEAFASFKIISLEDKGGIRWDDEKSGQYLAATDDLKMANRVRINYTTTLNLSAILNSLK